MDTAGRIRIFHGFNSVEKLPPYYEKNMRDGNLMEAIRDMGGNILRLGNMWTGWQPENGETINSTYVDILEVRICSFKDFVQYMPCKWFYKALTIMCVLIRFRTQFNLYICTTD